MARELPYLRPVPERNLSQASQRTTGWMIPMAWVEALPDWANTPVLGQVLWKWSALLLLFGLAIGTVLVVFLWGRRRPRDGSLWLYLRRLSAPVAILVLAPLLQHVTRVQINVTGSTAQLPFYLIEVALGVAVVWLVWLTVSWIAEAIIASPRVRSKSLDAHLIRLTARSVGIVAILVLMFRVAA